MNSLYNTQFEFDLNGRVTKQQVAIGDFIEYHSNAGNRLTEVINARKQSQQLTYDTAGRLVRWIKLFFMVLLLVFLSKSFQQKLKS